MGSGKDRIGATQSDDEAAGTGISDFEVVSVSFFAIYFTFYRLLDFRCGSFPIHFRVIFRFQTSREGSLSV
jgi:hypothetical protein